MSGDDFIVSDINLDGFQVVRGQYFSRGSEPCLTLWESAVSFNIPAFAALNNCEAVQLMVNLATRCILVKPVSSRETDAINWISDPTNPKTRKMECTMFTRRLFNEWGWDREQRYRVNGKLVKYGKNLMLLFDFTSPEVWKGMKLVREYE